MIPLGQELQKRGHRVTLFGILDTQPKALAAGIEFQAIGEKEFPLGVSKEIFGKLGKLKGIAALNYTIKFVTLEAV
jgi:UDP:flavonoid glycosyltransferase YjiC (YdhE family)